MDGFGTGVGESPTPVVLVASRIVARRGNAKARMRIRTRKKNHGMYLNPNSKPPVMFSNHRRAEIIRVQLRATRVADLNVVGK